MLSLRKSVLLTLSSLFIVSVATPVLAETAWERSHPRRDPALTCRRRVRP
jgi:hypothetical protein